MTHTAVVAAIDCGTNSTRLLIADTDGTVRQRSMRITRLGEGVDATHTLAPAAIARTVAVLEEYRGLMDQHMVERSRLVATSAARDARNGEDFLAQAGRAVGVPAELLSGDEEGHLSYRGATSGLPPANGDTVVVDIGGGSTELVMERSGALQTISMDIGCVRLSERHFLHDPPTATEVDGLIETIQVALRSALAAIPSLGELREGSRLIGLAGTVSTLTALELGLATYERSRIHHATLSFDAVERWCTALASETAPDRAARPGMIEGRQDVIVGGAFILREVMRTLGCTICLVSESDILDGMVESLRDAPRSG
jgi:exopolyphosphatase / guanosine-5'-triphosphate,3'-diphosphate pyrophosphatase